MIESIPNPLTDKGVKTDIENKVEELLKQNVGLHNIIQAIPNIVLRAAEWGMSEGFRMGWRVHETREKGGRL